MKVVPLTDDHAAAIGGWQYEFPYEWYDTSNDPQKVELFAHPQRRESLWAPGDRNYSHWLPG